MTLAYQFDTVADAQSRTAYDALCDIWARKLNEAVLRELASEYLRGIIDDCTTDAYEEFKRRESLGLLSDPQSAGLSRRSAKSRKGNRSSNAYRHRRV